MIKESNKNEKVIYTIFLIIIAICISFSLKTNSWNKTVIGVDSSVFITIGESMHEGKVPYKDIFDHKGVLLYFINYIGTIHDSYIMLYIIESIFLIVDIILLYKIAIMITKSKKISFLATALSLATFPLVLQGGNFAEEYTLPFTLLSLYIFLKKEKSKRDYLITGISFGAVILLKINMIPVWVIGYLFVAIENIYEKKYKEILIAIIYSLLGFVIILMPSIIYLLVNGAFVDFIEQYIIFNMRYSTSSNTSLISFLYDNCSMYFIAIILAVVNLYQIIKFNKNKEEKTILIFSLLFSLLTLIVLILPRNPYLHYTLGLIPCYIIPISYLAKEHFGKNDICQILIMSFTIACILFFSTGQKYADRNYPKPLYNIIERVETLSDENDDVLVLGNGLIVNLLSETSTNCKYIYQTPVIYMDKKIKNEVVRYIEENTPDIIVCCEFEETVCETLNKLIEKNIYYVDKVNNYVLVKNEEK